MKTSKHFPNLAKIAMLAFLLALCHVCVAHAAVGDVAGEVLSTDIVAYVDDMAIPSYNIGGKTVVVVEELADYGFDVTWNGESRILNVVTTHLPEKRPDYAPPKVAQSQVGKAVGKYYETDIVCYVNGMWVESYNIGGKTVAVIEDMASTDDAAKQNSRDGNIHRRLGYSYSLMKCQWNKELRRIYLYSLRPGGEVEIPGASSTTLCDIPFVRSAYQRAAWNLYDGEGDSNPVVAEWVDYIELDGCHYIPILGKNHIPGMSVELRGNTIAVDFDKDADGKAIIPKYLYDRITTSGSCYNLLLKPDVSLTVLGNKVESEKAVAYIYNGEIYVNITAINEAVSDMGKLMEYKYKTPDGVTEQTRIDDVLYTSTLLFINDRQIQCYDSASGKLYVCVADLEKHGFGVTKSGEVWVITPPDAPIPLTDEEKALHPEDYFRPNVRVKMYDIHTGIYTVYIGESELCDVYIDDCTTTSKLPCIDICELAAVCAYRVESSYRNGYIYRVYTH